MLCELTWYIFFNIAKFSNSENVSGSESPFFVKRVKTRSKAIKWKKE